MRSIFAFAVIVASATNFGFSILAADAEHGVAQNDFSAFCKKFNSAVIAGDKAAVAEVTKFPLSMPMG